MGSSSITYDTGRRRSSADSRVSDRSTMEAAVITGPASVSVESVERPSPGPGEVRVELEGSGICASDLPVWEGRSWFDYPREPGAPGHEGWGRVDRVGEGVTEVSVGDRVAVLSGHAYAEADTADVESVVPLPPSLDGKPFPGEPLGCAVNVFRRSDIRPGQTVAIVGIGFLGSLLTMLAADAGARVVAISRRPFALETASRCGADVTLAADADHLVEQVFETTGGNGCDRVIEAVGKQDPLTLAAKLTRVRGRLVIAGYHQDGMRQVDMQSWNWRGLDVINAHERDPAVYREGVERAVELVVEQRLDPSLLLTHSFRLDELSRGFRIIRERPQGFLKGVISL